MITSYSVHIPNWEESYTIDSVACENEFLWRVRNRVVSECGTVTLETAEENQRELVELIQSVVEVVSSRAGHIVVRRYWVIMEDGERQLARSGEKVVLLTKFVKDDSDPIPVI